MKSSDMLLFQPQSPRVLDFQVCKTTLRSQQGCLCIHAFVCFCAVLTTYKNFLISTGPWNICWMNLEWVKFSYPAGLWLWRYKTKQQTNKWEDHFDAVNLERNKQLGKEMWLLGVKVVTRKPHLSSSLHLFCSRMFPCVIFIPCLGNSSLWMESGPSDPASWTGKRKRRWLSLYWTSHRMIHSMQVESNPSYAILYFH